MLPSYRARFQQVLNEKLQDRVSTEGSTEKWTSFKETVNETTNEVLWVKNRTHDEKIKEAIHAKKMSYIEWLNDLSSVPKREKFKSFQAKVQTDLRATQDQWWREKAVEVQHYADIHNTKKFFSSLKTVFGPSASGSAPLLSSDGKALIKDQEGLYKCWRERFTTMLNRAPSVDSPWIRSPNSPYEFRSQNPLPSTRQSLAEHRGKMASPLRSPRQRTPTPLGPFRISCSLSGRRRRWQTTSATPWSSPSIRKSEVSRTVGTTGVFPSSQLQERSLRESSLTDSSHTANRSSLRHSAASDLAGIL